MSDWPVHGTITGPIVMIGFGSIGKGTLPLIERHFKYDKSRLVVIDPEDKDRKILDDKGIKFIHQAVTKQNYRELLTPLLTQGGGQGFCVNLSVDTSSLDIMEWCDGIGALYIDTVNEPWLGFYFDPKLDTADRSNYALREKTMAAKAKRQARLDHGGFLLRRQSGHGVLVRQAGPAECRGRPRAQVQGAGDARRLGQARQESRRQRRPHRRARHPARQEAERHRDLRQYLVDRGLPLGRHAAGRTRLGHARKVDAEKRT